MAFASGDVVVPFPHADVPAEKRRPAVVVSAPELEKQHSIVWLAMITSTAARWPADVRVTDLAASGLASACVVRPAKIATASAARIVRKAGTRPEVDSWFGRTPGRARDVKHGLVRTDRRWCKRTNPGEGNYCLLAATETW